MNSDERQQYVFFRAFGDPREIEVNESAERPEPARGQVRVRVEASSVQFTDPLIRRGV